MYKFYVMNISHLCYYWSQRLYSNCTTAHKYSISYRTNIFTFLAFLNLHSLSLIFCCGWYSIQCIVIYSIETLLYVYKFLLCLCSLSVANVNSYLNDLCMANTKRDRPAMKKALQMLLRNTSALEQVRPDEFWVLWYVTFSPVEMADQDHHEGINVFKIRTR